MPSRTALALLLLGGTLAACGVRGNPRPPLPEPRPPAAAPDGGR